jgi:linoleoyl-CoA desaturase
MKSIKFISNDSRQREFSAAVKKNVNDYFSENKLSKKGNLAMVIQTLTMVTIYIAPFVLILTLPMSKLVAALLTIIMGVGVAGIGMCVMHDANHGSYSNKDWVNRLFGATLYLLGSNVLNWKMQHNFLHHTYTNVEGYDQDIASKGPLRLSKFAPLKKMHKYQYIHAFFFYGLMTISKLVRDFTQLIDFNKAGITLQHHANPTYQYIKMIVTKLLYLLVIIGLPILITPFTWWQVLLGFFLMHLTAGCILSTVFQMAHVVEGTKQFNVNEAGVIDSVWAVHELETTSDFARNNLFLNYYVGGLNFQIEHHLFPKVCHIHYRKIAPIVERTAKEFGFVYNLKPTFLSALKSHIKTLKTLGRQP